MSESVKKVVDFGMRQTVLLQHEAVEDACEFTYDEEGGWRCPASV